MTKWSDHPTMTACNYPNSVFLDRIWGLECAQHYPVITRRLFLYWLLIANNNWNYTKIWRANYLMSHIYHTPLYNSKPENYKFLAPSRTDTIIWPWITKNNEHTGEFLISCKNSDSAESACCRISWLVSLSILNKPENKQIMNEWNSKNKKIIELSDMNKYHQENLEEIPAYQFQVHCPRQLSIQLEIGEHRDLGHSCAPSAMGWILQCFMKHREK